MVDSRLRIVASAFPRRCLLLTGAVVIFLAIPGGARAQTTTTLSASQDSWLDKANPDTNHGTDTTLVVDPKASSVKRTFVQFDLSSIPPCATINSATLKLTITTSGASSRAHAVHRLTQSWNEAGVAWKSRDGINSWPNPGGTFNATATATASTGTASGVVISWDVTGDVAAFVAGTAVNNGWVVKDISETGGASIQFLYGSRENAVAADRPVLEVTFTPPNCDDGNACTDDTCSPTTGCIHTNNTAPCDDGNACTTADTCSGGVCVGGPPPNCTPGPLLPTPTSPPPPRSTHNPRPHAQPPALAPRAPLPGWGPGRAPPPQTAPPATPAPTTPAPPKPAAPTPPTPPPATTTTPAPRTTPAATGAAWVGPGSI